MAREVKGHGFDKLASVEDARSQFLRLVPSGPLGVEQAPLNAALGRVLAKPLKSSGPLPPFDRSAMDGFAVRAADTFGASLTNPIPLKLRGASEIGKPMKSRVGAGECARIATGAMVPADADAVVMAEDTRAVSAEMVEVQAAATPWDNVSRKGEDVGPSEVLVPAGSRLIPADVAMAAAIGLRVLPVAKPPVVGVMSTGDELAMSSAPLKPGQIRDANRPGLLAAASEAGAKARDCATVRDDPARIRAALAKAVTACDLVVVSGGTSVGDRDFVPAAVKAVGSPGITVHGVAMRPGYPAAFGAARGVPIALLPGSPVAAALVFREFVGPAIDKMLGAAPELLPRGAVVHALAGRRIPGAPGLQTYARVVLVERGLGWVAEPVRISGSSILSSLVQSSGIVVVPPAKEGIEEGELVQVRLLRGLPADPARRPVPRRAPPEKEH